ncbi:hypothetical protein P170DRAFT_510559 [Aspergillus steynii IBT 23096]|uniref:Protein ZIP4 homolog n=1 Tax=Aspergillus steynii IBT 23096 TaxID=1392250 RepID=A0A2I2G4K4_9EURO|nr:uncharacterized protein P170DRAFT_510559 [Aspergillus steynii IBT 23096]PLB47814.1 hypothetical protein P170DRAFT_510559 [Aspergillus steynii IBT 23096]
MEMTHPDSLRAETIIEFAKEIQTRLSESDGFNEALHDDALRTLDKCIDHIPLPATAVPHTIRHQMDHEGVKLWNLCAQQMLHVEGSRDMILVCKLKVLAYLMIGSVASKQGQGSFRVLEVALNTAKACAETRQFDLSQRIIETIAVRLDDIEKSNSQHEHTRLRSATVEYYMLRVYLSWFRGRPDIADHLFSKIPATHIDKNQRCVLDICYKVGNLALLSHGHHTAVKWLGRAVKAYEQLSDDSQESDITLEEKKLVVMHTFVRACLRLDKMESKKPLNRALESLKTKYGDTFAVQMLQLEALGIEETLTGQEYLQIVQYAIKTVEHKHGHLNILLCYIQKLRELDVKCYVQALKQLLTEILVSPAERSLIESTFIRLVWTLTDASIEAQHALDICQDTSTALIETLQGPLSENATHASLILMWKYIDRKLSMDDAPTAQKWCFFVLDHPVFQISPDTRGKFLRKLIIYAMENPGSSTWHDLFHKMPIQCQQSPSALFLMHKYALARKDFSEASAYLQNLCEQADQANAYLLPCMGEAMQMGQALQAAKILERILASSDGACFEAMNVKDLFQPVLHHLLIDIETCDNNEEELILQITFIFEAGVSHAISNTDRRQVTNPAINQAGKQNEAQFSPIQLEWLSHKSYNVALRTHKHSQPKLALQLLDISVKFAELHQQTLPPETQPSINQHILHCDFLLALITVSQARKAKTTPQKKKNHQKLTHLTNHFHTHIHPLLNTHSPKIQEWTPKYRTILSWGFEAVVSLHKWDDAASVIEKAGTVTDGKLASIFLDCLLRSEAPVKEMARMVKLMIRTLHTSPSASENNQTFRSTLPRYLRILFRLSLSAKDTPLAESVLDQALILAQEAHQSESDASAGLYPNDEIQWLSTVAFNRAVEFYRASRDEECRRWAGKAIALADLIHGGGAGELGGLLRRNFAKLI